MRQKLPLEVRAEIVDCLLASMKAVDAGVDELWKAEVESRIDKYEAGGIDLIPGEVVLDKVRARFSK